MRRLREVLLVLLLTAGCSQSSGDKKASSSPPVVPARSSGTGTAALSGDNATEVSPAIASKVKQIIVEQLGVDESEVQLDTHLKDLNPDSLDVVELIMAFEEEFDVEISDEQAEKFTTVRSIAAWIEETLPSPE